MNPFIQATIMTMASVQSAWRLLDPALKATLAAQHMGGQDAAASPCFPFRVTAVSSWVSCFCGFLSLMGKVSLALFPFPTCVVWLVIKCKMFVVDGCRRVDGARLVI